MSNWLSNSTVPEKWSIMAGMTASGVLGLAFLLGAPGNLLVIWTIWQHVKSRSFTVVLILHLAVADLLAVITLPFWMYSLADSWIFGLAMCKAVVYVVNSSMYTSVFLITSMSVERYMAIRYPFSFRSQKRMDILMKLLAGIWALAFILAIPSIVTHQMDEVGGTSQCLFRKYSSLVQEAVCILLETMMGFVIPFIVLGMCYCQVAKHLQQMNLQQKQKSSILIACVIIAFAVCWLPYHSINTLSLVIQPDSNEAAETVDCFYDALALISGALAFISSSLNPVLYTFAARRFQGSLGKSGLVKLFQDIACHTSHFKQAESTNSAMTQTIVHIEQTTV